MTLYEITADLMRLIDMAEDELLDDEAIKDTFEALEGEFEAKADGYAFVVKELNADIEKLDAEIRRLSDRKEKLKNNAERIKKCLFDAMNATGKTKFKTALHSFAIANNGGKKPLVIDGDIPEEFMKQPAPIPNNEAIREYLETNVCGWAHLEERGQRLSIR